MPHSKVKPDFVKGAGDELKYDDSAAMTDVNFPGELSRKTTGNEKKVQDDLTTLDEHPMLGGNPGGTDLPAEPAPFFEGMPKGETGMVTEKFKKILK